MFSQSVSKHLFVKLIHTIKIAIIIYHNTINSAAEKTNITTTRRETKRLIFKNRYGICRHIQDGNA